MPEANGMILSKEEENDNEVRREDQDAINEFGRLNARLDEVKRQVDALKVRYALLLTSWLSKSSHSGLTNYLTRRKHWRKSMMPRQN